MTLCRGLGVNPNSVHATICPKSRGLCACLTGPAFLTILTQDWNAHSAFLQHHLHHSRHRFQHGAYPIAGHYLLAHLLLDKLKETAKKDGEAR